MLIELLWTKHSISDLLFTNFINICVKSTLEFQIEGEGRINGEAGKNTTIRNFIEIKSSNDLVKISTKIT